MTQASPRANRLSDVLLSGAALVVIVFGLQAAQNRLGMPGL